MLERQFSLAKEKKSNGEKSNIQNNHRLHNLAFLKNQIKIFRAELMINFKTNNRPEQRMSFIQKTPEVIQEG
jgi:hypothetical protein